MRVGRTARIRTCTPGPKSICRASAGGHTIPSRGLAVSNGHVAVAAGFDHDLASPVAGWYSGGSRSQMEASVRLQVDYAG